MQYYFKASDENEYGPIGEGEIHAWLQQGRMNQGSLVRAVDSEEWRPLNDYPEFMALLAPSSSNTTTTHPTTQTRRPPVRRSPEYLDRGTQHNHQERHAWARP